MFIRNPFNYDLAYASAESALYCEEASRTKQQFKEECDINTIVRRFNLTGELPSDVRAPQYADFEEAIDFHTAMNAIAMAHESFEQMPSDVRSRFNNDTGLFVDFCNDPKNVDEMIKMGLAVKREQVPSTVPSSPPPDPKA